MNRQQTKACRDGQIWRLASLCDCDVVRARSLYNRCVRFSLRYGRWNELRLNGGMGKHELAAHEHEGTLLQRLEDRMNEELGPHGIRWDHNGVYPTLVDEEGGWAVELIWY